MSTSWRLKPDSPYYDEFSDIQTGQWWITTPNGLIGCSSEEDAKRILGLEEQLQTAERRADEWEHAVTERERFLQEQLEAQREALTDARKFARDVGIFATHPAAPAEEDWEVVVGTASAVLAHIDRVLASSPAKEQK